VENRLGDFFGEHFDASAIRKTCQLKDGKFRVQYLLDPDRQFFTLRSTQNQISSPVSPTVYTKETLLKMAKMRQAHPKKIKSVN